MNRRQFLATALAALLAGGFALPTLRTADDDIPPLPRWRRFQITTHVILPDANGPAQLWLPLCQTVDGYQSSALLNSGSSGTEDYVYDAHYGAPMVRTFWQDRGLVPHEAVVRQFVDVRERTSESEVEIPETNPGCPLQPLSETERRFWTTPAATRLPEGAVPAVAAGITAGLDGQFERLRAIYDWVIDHAPGDPAVSGERSAELNGLLVGMARAAGFPARVVYGLRVAPSRWFTCLGADGRDLARAQHCRAEVYLQRAGWLPVDPAAVVRAAAFERLPADDARLRDLREFLFGNAEANWVGYNSATDLVLPGYEGDLHRPEFPFLMYPHALTADGLRPCTDPTWFRYEITARELPPAG